MWRRARFTAGALAGVAGVVLGAAALFSGCAISPVADNTSASPSVSATSAPLSPDEQMPKVAQCLRDKGWDVTYNPSDRSISYVGSAVNDERYSADEQACVAQYPGDTRSFSELSPAEQQAQYQAVVDLVVCIRKAGYQLPDPPSRESWLEARAAESPDLYLPYAKLRVLSQSEMTALQMKCPQQ